MRDEEAPARVDVVQDALVELLQLYLVVDILRVCSQADEAKGRRSHQLIAWGLADLLRQPLGEATMLANAGRQPLLSEVAHDHPELERAEAAPQRVAVIHQVWHFI